MIDGLFSGVSGSILIFAGAAFAATFASVWLLFLLLTRSIEDATRRTSQGVLGIFSGATAAFAIFMAELATVGASILAMVLSAPEIVLALFGLGSVSGWVDVSPGMFAIGAIGIILAARMVDL